MKTIFISYAHEDDYYKKELIKHLSPFVQNNKIKIWQSGLIIPGKEWDKTIKSNLKSADIALFLMSSDSISSYYINEVELKKAMKAHEKGKKVVVPVILRPCKWNLLPISKLQGLPKLGKPISTWDNIDNAFVNIVEGVEKII